MPLVHFPTPTRLVRIALICSVVAVAFYFLSSSQWSEDYNVPLPRPLRPAPVDVSDGEALAREHGVDFDWHQPVAGQVGHNSRNHYFKEVKTVPKQFDKFHSTVNRLTRPSSLRNRHYFRDDPRRQVGMQQPMPEYDPLKLYNPYPDYNSQEWKETRRADYQPCFGPRGILLNESLDDAIYAYIGAPEGFPAPMFGSHDALQMDSQVSFDRYGRYGPYGFGEDEFDVEGWNKPRKVDWSKVDWAWLQQDCADKNYARYGAPRKNSFKRRSLQEGEPEGQEEEVAESHIQPRNSRIPPEKRSAFLIRSWTGKKYTENDMQNIRSLITEMSLMSGGEYEVILLVHSKDESIPIWEEDAYQKVLEENVPREFWDITELWNMRMVKEPYDKLDDSFANVHLSQWLPLQAFARRNPEFEYFWNWEVDSRFTGHTYELCQKMVEFGRRQPRKGMWERSHRFWIPALHGDYDDQFRKYVQRREDQFVWGPYGIPDVTKPLGPRPPVDDPADDDYEWGVGEEADYISLLPIFDPEDTNWVIRDHVFGYQQGTKTPRRTTIITQTRISARLLNVMHVENSQGRHAASEMFPQTAALHHGLKAVYAPHPVYHERNWHPHRVDRYFNNGPFGNAGGGPDSPFGWGLEGRFKGVSWYYRANLPGLLYWNFLGWRHERIGGKKWEARNGRVCLPPILFHPVKDPEEYSDTYYEFDADM